MQNDLVAPPETGKKKEATHLFFRPTTAWLFFEQTGVQEEKKESR